jgi:hypothetical protein
MNRTKLFSATPAIMHSPEVIEKVLKGLGHVYNFTLSFKCELNKETGNMDFVVYHEDDVFQFNE